MQGITGYFRTYNMDLTNPIPPDCVDFNNYTQNQLQGGRQILSFTPSKIGNECLIQLKMKCWSCGKNSPNNFQRDILIKFPDATIKSFSREKRASKKRRNRVNRIPRKLKKAS